MLSPLQASALFLALLGAVDATPGLLPIVAATGRTRPGGYIVTLKEAAVARRSLSAAHRSLLSSLSPSDSHIAYEWPTLNAFAGTFSEAALTTLRSASEVASIEYDTIGGVNSLIKQTDAPWNLQRVAQTQRLNRTDYDGENYSYVYDSSAGKGVDVYVIDTGVNNQHHDFEGRVRWGKNFGGYLNFDAFGHGTHVAGTVAGKRFGVAKAATIVAVRVLDDDGAGPVSDAIAAVNWIVEEVTTRTHTPSVINISLKYEPSVALDAAVTAAVNAGIHVVVSAGNDARDTTAQSPARAEAVITVGATDINDAIWPKSNYGPRVDIFAPGVNVVSLNNRFDDLYGPESGTSQATPHVAGLIAYVIAKEGNKSPAEMLARIKEWSPDGILSGIPANTNNELVNNGARYINPLQS